MYIPQFILHWWRLSYSCLNYCKWCCNKYWGGYPFWLCFFLAQMNTEWYFCKSTVLRTPIIFILPISTSINRPVWSLFHSLSFQHNTLWYHPGLKKETLGSLIKCIIITTFHLFMYLAIYVSSLEKWLLRSYLPFLIDLVVLMLLSFINCL